jgi:hypothetical protein
LATAESLDALITAYPEIFLRPDDSLPLRGPTLLVRVDRRTRMFTPHGLAPGAPMSDEDALVLIQQQLRILRVSSDAPPAVRDQLKALCDLAIYGCFAYDFNHVVVTMAALAHELALGGKFVEVSGGRVRLLNVRTSEAATLDVTLFGELADAMSRDGQFPHARGWRVQDHPSFRPSLAHLVGWAHECGYFRASLDQLWPRVRWNVVSIELTRASTQKWIPPEYDSWPESRRSDWWETAGRAHWERDYLRTIPGIRNRVAHPSTHSTTSPIEAARAIAQLVAFIGWLWPEAPAAGGEPELAVDAAQRRAVKELVSAVGSLALLVGVFGQATRNRRSGCASGTSRPY